MIRTLLVTALLCAAPAAQDRHDPIQFGDPTVAPIDVGPNGVRMLTPALEISDYAVRTVDLDALRERRLAMYERGATFDTSMPSPSTVAPQHNGLDTRVHHQLTPHSPSALWTVALVLSIGALVMAVLIRRARA